jgi:hypothetical protein
LDDVKGLIPLFEKEKWRNLNENVGNDVSFVSFIFRGVPNQGDSVGQGLQLSSYVFPLNSENLADWSLNSSFGKECSSDDENDSPQRSNSQSQTHYSTYISNPLSKFSNSVTNLLNIRRKSKSTSNISKMSKFKFFDFIDEESTKTNKRSSLNEILSFRSKKKEVSNLRKLSHTLTDILQDIKLRSTFKNFTESEYSSENVNFWEDVEKFKRIRDLNKRIEEGERIFEMYLTSISEQEINVCADTSKNL